MKLSKQIKIAFIPTANSGVTFYRMASFAWQMRKHPEASVALYGYTNDQWEVHPWQKEFHIYPEIRYKIESLCEVADVVIWGSLHYLNTLEFFGEMQMKYNKPMLVECDDNYLDTPPWNEAYHSYHFSSPVKRAAIDHMRMADGLILSTPYLAELYKKFNPNTFVVQNSLDLSKWDEPKKHKGLRIGWIGGGSHEQDLKNVYKPIMEILEEYKDVKFYCVHGCPPFFKDCERVVWTHKYAPIHQYPGFVSRYGFDIGIAPLEHCTFNYGKSNLRWLEMSALKIPTVATRISHFEQTIEHGRTGLLVENNDPGLWKKCLSELIESQSLRYSMGMEAYNEVKNKFNVRKTASSYLQFLKKLVGYGTKRFKEETWIEQPYTPTLARNVTTPTTTDTQPILSTLN